MSLIICLFLMVKGSLDLMVWVDSPRELNARKGKDECILHSVCFLVNTKLVLSVCASGEKEMVWGFLVAMTPIELNRS